MKAKTKMAGMIKDARTASLPPRARDLVALLDDFKVIVFSCLRFLGLPAEASSSSSGSPIFSSLSSLIY